MDEGRGAGLGLLVIAHEAAVAHQPVPPQRDALHNPASREHLETGEIVGPLDYLDLQGGASPLDSVGNGVSAEPALDPQFPEPLECAHQGLQKGHGPASFDRVRRHDGRTEHEAKGVHQEEELAALDLLGRISADRTAMRVGLHALL